MITEVDFTKPGGVCRPLIVAVEDEVLAGSRLSHIVHGERRREVHYLPRSVVERAATDVDYWVERPKAREGRRLVAETFAGEVFEQETVSGRLFCDGEPMYEEPLVAFGTPSLGQRGTLCVGHGAAFLLAGRKGPGWMMRIGATSPLLWVYEQPFVTLVPIILEGWLEHAALMRSRLVVHA